MTRTQLVPQDPHNARKAFRAQARAQGLTYPQAVAAAKEQLHADGARPEFLRSDAARRRLAVAQRVHAAQELGSRDARDEWQRETDDIDDDDFEPAHRTTARVEVNLLDIARPAKVRRRRQGPLSKKSASHHVPADDDWERWTEASFAETEAWELDSVLSHSAHEEWQIPVRDYTEAEWDALVERASVTSGPR
ncbi:hypothetical protein MIND_00649500 [Mycena indigotica]|uniref:Uncharacterized protein n=1 Tax=Mycena indigotica TaxID=2126181 RepID=A0A8H6SRN8_9AGAR|nr:uncharacterized protein MIND_00649500 [Mycena indigotica]KAF7304174.1 hypothetical protein MIND_00649500 [Mycena indigotica]